MKSLGEDLDAKMDIQAQAAGDKLSQEIDNKTGETLLVLKKNEDFINENRAGLEVTLKDLESTTSTAIQTDRNNLEADINTKSSLISTYDTSVKDNAPLLQENEALLTSKLQESEDADMKSSLARVNKSVGDLKQTYLSKNG